MSARSGLCTGCFTMPARCANGATNSVIRVSNPRLVASAPHEVWTWDITRLPGPRKWVTYPLCVVLDLFSRFVVAWMVAARESAALAKRLITNACAR